MRILCYTDCHFSQFSSIVRNKGEKYSIRLENELQSINWAEKLAMDLQCQCIVCNGDMFDKPDLNAEELTALQEIQWARLPHYFLVGNHEMGINDLSISSAHLLKMVPMATVIDKPCWIGAEVSSPNIRLLFLPYILETARKPFDYYMKHSSPIFDDISSYSKTIVFSHNDIKGIRYGQYESKAGFDVEEITNNCDLYINGHLHNQQQINEKILNLGNLTGQNFSEDALKYSHCAAVIDTETLSVDLINNPFALNFYKLEINDITDFTQLDRCQNNAVVAIKVKENLADQLKVYIADKKYMFVQSRIIILPALQENKDKTVEELITHDHIKQFKDFIIEELGVSDVLYEELNKL